MSAEVPFQRPYWVRLGQTAGWAYAGRVPLQPTTAKLAGLLRCGLRQVSNLLKAGELEACGPFRTDYLPGLPRLAAAEGRRIHRARYPIPEVAAPMPQSMWARLD